MRCGDFIREERFASHDPPLTWEEAGSAELFKYHRRCFRDPFVSSDRSIYEITDRMMRFRYSFRPTEPWGLLRREDAVWADEDFANGPMDKQQFVSALLDRGVRFYAVPEVFVFHLWHPEERQGWPDRARNVSIWLKRHSMAPSKHVFIDVGGALPPHLAVSFGNYLESGLGQKADCDPPASPVSVSLDEGRCLEAMEQGVPVIVGPPYLSRALLGRQYRVSVFFRSPAYYRKVGSVNGRQYGAQDGSFLAWVTGTSCLFDAASRVENAAILCDAGNPSGCCKALQNLLGFPVPSEWLRDWARDVPSDKPEKYGPKYRRKYPLDYQFYDYMRIVGRCE
jgi:hypothetical protein